MAIVPDDKNWTWVLEKTCPECEFDAGSVPESAVAGLLRANADEWVEVLEGSSVRDRPDSSTWSPVEYACHVRDVFDIYTTRLALMLAEDDPLFANWDQDATAIEKQYDQQDPAAVSASLHANAQVLADLFDTVSGSQWERTGRRSDGASFTVSSFSKYFIHDPVHHLWDVTN